MLGKSTMKLIYYIVVKQVIVYEFKRRDSEIERAGYVMKMSDSIIIS